MHLLLEVGPNLQITWWSWAPAVNLVQPAELRMPPAAATTAPTKGTSCATHGAHRLYSKAQQLTAAFAAAPMNTPSLIRDPRLSACFKQHRSKAQQLAQRTTVHSWPPQSCGQTDSLPTFHCYWFTNTKHIMLQLLPIIWKHPSSHAHEACGSSAICCSPPSSSASCVRCCSCRIRASACCTRLSGLLAVVSSDELSLV